MKNLYVKHWWNWHQMTFAEPWLYQENIVDYCVCLKCKKGLYFLMIFFFKSTIFHKSLESTVILYYNHSYNKLKSFYITNFKMVKFLSQTSNYYLSFNGYNGCNIFDNFLDVFQVFFYKFVRWASAWNVYQLH